MDYVDGQSLSQVLAAGRLSIPRVVRMGIEAARVRAFALRDKGVAGEAEQQARLALSIAMQQDWRHRPARSCPTSASTTRPAPPPRPA